MFEPSINSVSALLILTDANERILSKFYDQKRFPSDESRRSFEKKVSIRLQRCDMEVGLVDGLVVVHGNLSDIHLYVACSELGNEIMMLVVLQCLCDSLNNLFHRSVSLKALLDSYEILALLVDEVVDHGIILEVDPRLVSARVMVRFDEIVGDSGMKEMLHVAKNHLAWSILK